MKKTVLTKINEARIKIKSSKLKKEGRNDFSKYDYYTPEQVNKLVYEACKDLNLLNIFQLKRTELGLMAEMSVIDLDTGDSEVFMSATDIPSIKATNVSQQIGGCMTYSERYMLMFLYDIKDNNLDFDTPKQNLSTKKQLTGDELTACMKEISEGKHGSGVVAYNDFILKSEKKRQLTEFQKDEIYKLFVKK